MYRKSVLKNGARVVSCQMEGRDSVSLGIWCGTGGRFESDELKGAAHFLEHIVFKGTKKYSCTELKERVEGVGGSLNAFTAEEQTCYYAKIPSQYVSKTFDVLADMVFFPLISRKDVDSERGVILEEIKMYYDLPQYFVVDALEALMWPEHPLGKGLAGNARSVSAMSDRQLMDFHKAHYVPNNIVLASCGNVSHEMLVDILRKKMGRLPIGYKLQAVPAQQGPSVPKAAFFERPIEQMHLALGMFGFDAFHKDRYALNLLNVILGGNMSSRLFNEVREKRGLAYSIHSSAKSLMDTGIFVIRAGVDNTKVVQALDVILKELAKIRKGNISRSEFSRAKDYIVGQMLLGLEDTMEHMLWIGESTMVRDRIRTADEVVRAIRRVRLEDIQRAADQVLDPSGHHLAVVGPLTEGQGKKMRGLLGIRGA